MIRDDPPGTYRNSPFVCAHPQCRGCSMMRSGSGTGRKFCPLLQWQSGFDQVTWTEDLVPGQVNAHRHASVMTFRFDSTTLADPHPPSIFSNEVKVISSYCVLLLSIYS